MNFLQVLEVGLVLLASMTALWLISLALKDSSIIDIFWGTGFVIVAWVTAALTGSEFHARKWLVVTLVTVWGLRLTLHLLWRNFGEPEDFRYQVWRRQAGAAWWWRSYFQVFFLQGILLWIIAVPLVSAQTSATLGDLTALDYIATLVWLLGFFFEAVGDWQLMRFRANPENTGKVLDSGVWRYTRHPNYFGDAVQWWAFYLLALAAGGWWTVFSPLLMTFLLLRVSGVTMLEKSLKHTKPAYADYAARTSAFFPWFPKRGGTNSVR